MKKKKEKKQEEEKDDAVNQPFLVMPTKSGYLSPNNELSAHLPPL